MAWGKILTTLGENIGVSVETTILIIVCIGSLIFAAKDFKLGAIMLFVSSGLVFMLSYYFQVNYIYPLVVFLMSLIVMAFSLYFVKESGARGGLI